VFSLEMCTGPTKQFRVLVKDLRAVSLISLLNFCLTAHFVEKCMLLKLIYFKTDQKSSLSNNSGNIITRIRAWCILKYIGLKSLYFSTKRAVKQQFNNEINETARKSLTETRNFFWSRVHF